jgi:3-hydroxyisobutyrate dehydrogenase-like beta-hydroxyacid dehydrogenase
MDARARTMVQGKFDFGFAVDWMRKDLGIALGEARRNGAQLPGTALIDQFLGRVQELGGGREDVSAVIKLIAPRH